MPAAVIGLVREPISNCVSGVKGRRDNEMEKAQHVWANFPAGHGVHSAFHSGLVILHYDNEVYRDVMEPGMTFTIEPMLALGDPSSHVWDDDWTVVTNDRSRVAQFEQSLAVTPDGAEILTVP